MLLLRCSLLADSISRSISFWPSTIATRSSSAWVALNSMRFIGYFPCAGIGRGLADGEAKAPVRALRLAGGGRRREKPCRQRELPGYEGSDAGIRHRGRLLIDHSDHHHVMRGGK